VVHRTASRARPCRGETANGDRALVRALDDGLLLAVIDGLGHGPDAERAALLAVATLTAHPADGVISLLEATHRSLRGSRGCAATIVLARGRSLSIVGVGNVATRVFGGKPITHRPSPGIVGHSLGRNVRPLELSIDAPLRVVMTSDGVSQRYDESSLDGLGPEAACERLLAQHSVAHDDATALVADLFASR
jgi:negative regulator of sigma-B (phosphoserine phosphatase)